MKVLPSVSVIKNCFEDFAKFSFQLIEEAATDPRKMKFAVVNAQVALELYLKYYFMARGDESILKQKNGTHTGDFVDFSQILNHYFSENRKSYGNKKELHKILYARNAILHRGDDSVINEDLALNVVCALFFIHSTMRCDSDDFLFSQKYVPQPISGNQIWRKGVERFIGILTDFYDSIEIRTCGACQSYSVVNGYFFALTASHEENNFICLTCFFEYDVEHEAVLIECNKCSKKSYLIDRFNEQRKQLYVGGCTECGADAWVRRCKNCGEFYHPLESCEEKYGNSYFCSSDCLIGWQEEHKIQQSRKLLRRR